MPSIVILMLPELIWSCICQPLNFRPAYRTVSCRSVNYTTVKHRRICSFWPRNADKRDIRYEIVCLSVRPSVIVSHCHAEIVQDIEMCFLWPQNMIIQSCFQAKFRNTEFGCSPRMSVFKRGANAVDSKNLTNTAIIRNGASLRDRT